MTDLVTLLASDSALSTGEMLLFGAIGVLGLALAGLLAGLETGLYSLSQVRLAVRAARGDRGAARLAREQARPQRLLSALLVVHALASWFAGFGTSQIFHGLGYSPIEAILLELVVLVPAIFVFGEVLPKDLFRVNADRWLPRYSGFLRAIRAVLSVTGVVWVVEGLGIAAARLLGASIDRRGMEARAKVAALLAEGAGGEGLSETQLGFADRVFTMRGIEIGQEMRPWKSVAAVPSSASPEERARKFLASGSSRLPVVDANGAVIGIIAAVDHFARPQEATQAIARPVLLLGPNMSALDAISRMRRDRVQMAVVGERLEKPLGIVSMKDLVEPLVGDLVAW